MDQLRSERNAGPWTPQEHLRFIEGVKVYGRDWIKIISYVPTRNKTQIRSHAQKFFNKLEHIFQSRNILGEQSEEIMGPPQNLTQYALYKQMVGNEPLIHENALLCFSSRKSREGKQNLNLEEHLSKKSVSQSDNFSKIDEKINVPELQKGNINLIPSSKTNTQGFFFEVISSNRHKCSLQHSIENFMQFFVDIKPDSTRRTSCKTRPIYSDDGANSKFSFYSHAKDPEYTAPMEKNIETGCESLKLLNDS